jgi:hypothetical protein
MERIYGMARVEYNTFIGSVIGSVITGFGCSGIIVAIYIKRRKTY